MNTNKKINFDKVRAGSIGAFVRWQNHVKKPTTHIRIYKDDYNKLVSLVGKLPSCDSISSAFAYAVDRVCSRRCMACKKP